MERPADRSNRAFSSFPDTSLFSEGTILFSFKIRHISPDPATLAKPEPLSPLPKEKGMEERLMGMAVQDTECSPIDAVPGNGTVPALMSTGQKAEEYRKWDERGREWLYGFVWFEQRRDKRITRGYMQVSEGFLLMTFSDLRLLEITGNPHTPSISSTIFRCSAENCAQFFRIRVLCH